MSRLETWARFTVGLLVTAVLSIITIAVLVLLLPWRHLRIRVCNVYGKVLGRSVLYIAGTTPLVRHHERIAQSYPAIYVSNHSSVLDVFAGIWLCPYGGCGVGKKEIIRAPFFGQLYLLSGHLRVDRGNRESAIAALKDTAELVKKHHLSLWIWPEGTRSRDGRLLPLKKGFAHMALATGLPIVPIVLHNAHKGWAARTFTLHRLMLEVDVLPAIDTSQWRLETLDSHIAEVHKAFADTLGDEQKPITSTAVARSLEPPAPAPEGTPTVTAV
ncbi:MAG: 1-acyl-sn-glycerol-3-phosphate acyltransferase [Deltaproteobacteria bacterium]|nr:1-acyl-sn-glycerol-3-phosphate acyltransferase [Deltaproteobacteria bacterium]